MNIKHVVKKSLSSVSQSGFTLVELLIYMGILSLLLGVLMAIFSVTLDSRLETESLSSVQQDARYLLNRLSYDISRAQSISTPATKGSTSSTLVLAEDNGSGSTTNYTYSIDGSGNLVLTTDSGTDALNSYNTMLTSVSFLRIGNTTGGKDQIRFTIAFKSRILQHNTYETKTITSTVGLR